MLSRRLQSAVGSRCPVQTASSTEVLTAVDRVVSATYPSYQAGDLIIVSVLKLGSNAGVINTPSGFDLLREYTISGSSRRAMFAKRLMNGSEGSSLSVSYSSGDSSLTRTLRVNFLVVRNASGDVSFSSEYGTLDGTLNPPAVTASWGVANNQFLVSVLGPSYTIDPPSGYIRRFDNLSGSYSFDFKNAYASSDDPPAFSVSGTGSGDGAIYALTLAIRPR